MKQVVIINGKANVGKDTFVNLCKKHIGTINYSSVRIIKFIAEAFFDYSEDIKSDKDRKFLADFKELVDTYCDFTTKEIMKKYNDFLNSNMELLFIHIREPENIEKIKNLIPNCKTLCVTSNRNNIREINNSHADKDVMNYNYDYYIRNNQDKGYLEVRAINFIHILKIINENSNDTVSIDTTPDLCHRYVPEAKELPTVIYKI